MRPLLAALREAQQAAGEARGSLLRLVPDPDDTMLAGGGGAQAFVRAEAAEQDAASLQHLADAEAALPGRVTALRASQQAVASAADLVRALEAARADLPGQIGALEEQLAAARLAGAGLGAAREQQAALSRRAAAAADLAGLEPALAGQNAALLDAVDTHQTLTQAHLQLMAARLEGMAAELAAQLADGCACPVCGSTAHPAPAQAAGGLVSDQDLAAAAARRDAAGAARAQLTRERDAWPRRWRPAPRWRTAGRWTAWPPRPRPWASWWPGPSRRRPRSAASRPNSPAAARSSSGSRRNCRRRRPRWPPPRRRPPRPGPT